MTGATESGGGVNILFPPPGVHRREEEKQPGGQDSSQKQSCLEKGCFLILLWQILYHPTQAANGRVLCRHCQGEATLVFLKLAFQCAIRVLDCLLH